MSSAKKSTLTLVFALAILILQVCPNISKAGEAAATSLLEGADAERMLQTIERISATPRQYGEKEAEPARQLIFDTLTEYGYDVTKHEFSYTQEEVVFLAGYEETVPDEFIEGENFVFDDVTRTGCNVVAVRRPDRTEAKEDILIVCAHYDSVMDCPGANDNGSGVAALLEIARLIKDVPSNIELRLIAFDGEESFALGSHTYVDSLSEEEVSRIIGVINFDMFAAKEANGLQMSTIDGRHNFLSEMFDGFKLRDKKSASDHVSFMSAAIPVVSISHERDSRSDTADDRIGFIDAKKLVTAANKGAEVICRIMSEDSPSPVRSREINEDIVFDLELSDSIPFYENVQTVEEKLGIEPVQIPVLETEHQEVILDYAALVDWWGEPLETHFVYNFMTLSDSMLSSIRILLNDSKAVRDMLNNHYERIEDVGTHTFFFENGDVAQAWQSSENVFALIENNGLAELIVVKNENQESNADN